MRKICFFLAVLLAAVFCFSALSDGAYPAAPAYSDRAWKADTGTSRKSTLPPAYRTSQDDYRSTATDLPSREGLETLHISGSGQFNADSFREMIEDIRTRTDGVICVFDLRQETHGFVNGTAVSLYAKKNAGNAGLDAGEVLELEKRQLGELLGTELALKSSSRSKDGATPKPATVIDVDEVMTEAELCASEDVRYVRIACTDLLCPEDEDVDDFMSAYLALPEGAWLHFHCAAGVGRTGLFMMMADMLRNPDVPIDTIIDRQVLLGASDPRKEGTDESEESDEKLELLQQFHNYVLAEQRSGFPDSFSVWKRFR